MFVCVPPPKEAKLSFPKSTALSSAIHLSSSSPCGSRLRHNSQGNVLEKCSLSSLNGLHRIHFARLQSHPPGILRDSDNKLRFVRLATKGFEWEKPTQLRSAEALTFSQSCGECFCSSLFPVFGFRSGFFCATWVMFFSQQNTKHCPANMQVNTKT